MLLSMKSWQLEGFRAERDLGPKALHDLGSRDEQGHVSCQLLKFICRDVAFTPFMVVEWYMWYTALSYATADIYPQGAYIIMRYGAGPVVMTP